jgi:hypothetical protein
VIAFAVKERRVGRIIKNHSLHALVVQCVQNIELRAEKLDFDRGIVFVDVALKRTMNVMIDSVADSERYQTPVMTLLIFKEMISLRAKP